MFWTNTDTVCSKHASLAYVWGYNTPSGVAKPLWGGILGPQNPPKRGFLGPKRPPYIAKIYIYMFLYRLYGYPYFNILYRWIFSPRAFLPVGRRKGGCFGCFGGSARGGRPDAPDRPRNHGLPTRGRRHGGIFGSFGVRSGSMGVCQIWGYFRGYFRGFLRFLWGPRAEMMVPWRWYACFYIYEVQKYMWMDMATSQNPKNSQKWSCIIATLAKPIIVPT